MMCSSDGKPFVCAVIIGFYAIHKVARISNAYKGSRKKTLLYFGKNCYFWSSKIIFLCPVYCFWYPFSMSRPCERFHELRNRSRNIHTKYSNKFVSK